MSFIRKIFACSSSKKAKDSQKKEAKKAQKDLKDTEYAWSMPFCDMMSVPNQHNGY